MKVPDVPSVSIWFDGLKLNKDFNAGFSKNNLINSLKYVFNKNSIVKNYYCSKFFNDLIINFDISQTNKGDSNYILNFIENSGALINGSVKYNYDSLLFDFEKMFNYYDSCIVDIKNPVLKEFVDKSKFLYSSCGNFASEFFFNNIFTSKVVDFINSNFRYYPMCWHSELFNDFYDDMEDDCRLNDLPFKILHNKRSFLLGELDFKMLNLFEGEKKQVLDSHPLSTAPPIYFPLVSYCTFLDEDGFIFFTKKVGNVDIVVDDNEVFSYYHILINGNDEVKKIGYDITSLNCLSDVVDNEFNRLITSDMMYDSWYYQ